MVFSKSDSTSISADVFVRVEYYANQQMIPSYIRKFSECSIDLAISQVPINICV